MSEPGEHGCKNYQKSTTSTVVASNSLDIVRPFGSIKRVVQILGRIRLTQVSTTRYSDFQLRQATRPLAWPPQRSS